MADRVCVFCQINHDWSSEPWMCIVFNRGTQNGTCGIQGVVVDLLNEKVLSLLSLLNADGRVDNS